MRIRAKKCEWNGIPFDSRGEMQDGQALFMREKAGEIKGLEYHPLFPLKINGIQVGIYKPDARYFMRIDGVWVPTAHEYKGYLTDRDAFRIKVFQACYPQLRFVKAGPWKRRRHKTR